MGSCYGWYDLNNELSDSVNPSIGVFEGTTQIFLFQPPVESLRKKAAYRKLPQNEFSVSITHIYQDVFDMNTSF